MYKSQIRGINTMRFASMKVSRSRKADDKVESYRLLEGQL